MKDMKYEVWNWANFWKNTSSYYGSLPKSFFRKIKHKRDFQVNGKRTLHLFSGPHPWGDVRVDINPKVKPDVVANAEYLPFKNRSFGMIFADPPYDEREARKYGYPYPKFERWANEASRCLTEGGILLKLEYLNRKNPRDMKLFYMIPVILGLNRKIRLLQCYKKIGAAMAHQKRLTEYLLPFGAGKKRRSEL